MANIRNGANGNTESSAQNVPARVSALTISAATIRATRPRVFNRSISTGPYRTMNDSLSVVRQPSQRVVNTLSSAIM
ncbi:hypothetical protein GCM10018962_02990 [Dactylosporangium matsuzakiense]|uniref:Uncharacterized protein n=1 Tax=Dactylosporangium matsuzakiense TaxID=53360 RepID=A0A9W6KDZ4_9ACTN|nr:hypothetical protein GCM10017581_020710 [Dactylosporangium matsuzakiense]